MAKRSLVQIIREEKFLLIGASFLVAHSAAGFLTAVISDLIMPPISEALGESDWTTAAVEAGPISLKWGDSLGTGLHLVVVLLIGALIFRHLKKEEAPAPTKRRKGLRPTPRKASRPTRTQRSTFSGKP